MSPHPDDETPSPGPQPGWQSTLRSRGYRLTPQRELVLRAVERLGHATPDEVLTEIVDEVYLPLVRHRGP